MEAEKNKQWDPTDKVLILPIEGDDKTGFQVEFSIDSLLITPREIGDTIVYDTTTIAVEPVEAGDVFGIYTTRPFSNLDIYRFTTVESQIDDGLASNELDRIAVVPNPYVVTASWEPQPLNRPRARPESVSKQPASRIWVNIRSIR